MKTFYINDDTLEACTDKELQNVIGYGTQTEGILGLGFEDGTIHEQGTYIEVMVDAEELDAENAFKEREKALKALASVKNDDIRTTLSYLMHK